MSDDQPTDKKLTAYERWELPNLETSSPTKTRSSVSALAVKAEEAVEVTEVIDEESLVYEPLTAQQLEEIRSAAYEEGFTQGEQDGYQKGQQEGFEKGQESGYSEGHEKGLEAGKQTALEQGVEIAQSQLGEIEQMLNAVLQEFEQPLESSRDEAEQILRIVAKRLVEHVLLCELSEQSEQLLSSELAKTLSSLSEFEGRASLVVHPTLMEAAQALAVDSRLQIKFKSDESLLPGGFMLDSQSFFVDGRIETRLQDILKHLDKH